jgi:hypothetical protein
MTRLSFSSVEDNFSDYGYRLCRAGRKYYSISGDGGSLDSLNTLVRHKSLKEAMIWLGSFNHWSCESGSCDIHLPELTEDEVDLTTKIVNKVMSCI